MTIYSTRRGSSSYPAGLAWRLGECAPDVLYLLGDEGILGRVDIGLICSVRCPGSLVFMALDTVRAISLGSARRLSSSMGSFLTSWQLALLARGGCCSPPRVIGFAVD